MNFVDQLCKAIDPEAFREDALTYPYTEETLRLLERREHITRAVANALGSMEDNFKIVETPVPSYDGDYYHIDGYGDGKGKSLSLNDKSLGFFLVTLLQMGGDICQVSAFNAKFKNSHVAAVVKLHPSRKDQFEKATGLTLCEPSRLVPASGSTLSF